MRTWFLPNTFLAVILLAQAVTGRTQTLSIRVEGIQQNKGPLLIAVFQSEKGFPFEHKLAVGLHRAEPDNGIATLNIPLPDGRYAIALFQDSNGDGQLNTNFLGIPKEGYGVSNNAFNRFSAPEFNAASFNHKGKTALKIKMKY
jgi:uncharacterized protein (DUF2141 family)